MKSYVNGIGVGYRFERMIKLIEEERRNNKEKKHSTDSITENYNLVIIKKPKCKLILTLRSDEYESSI